MLNVSAFYFLIELFLMGVDMGVDFIVPSDSFDVYLE